MLRRIRIPIRIRILSKYHNKTIETTAGTDTKTKSNVVDEAIDSTKIDIAPNRNDNNKTESINTHRTNTTTRNYIGTMSYYKANTCNDTNTVATANNNMTNTINYTITRAKH